MIRLLSSLRLPSLLTLTALVGLGALTGCGGSEGIPVVVGWSFNGLAACDVAGVRAVDIMVYDDEGAIYAEGERACDEGPTTLSLPPGNFTLMAEAISWNNLRVFSGGRTFTVEDAQDIDLGELDLGRSSRFGTADMVMHFGVEDAPLCSMPNVTSLQVAIGQGTDGEPMFMAEWPCDDLPSVFIPELPVGEVHLDCRAMDDQGKTQYSHAWSDELRPDAVHTLGMVNLYESE